MTCNHIAKKKYTNSRYEILYIRFGAILWRCYLCLIANFLIKYSIGTLSEFL
jgi:hypothetical protein